MNNFKLIRGKILHFSILFISASIPFWWAEGQVKIAEWELGMREKEGGREGGGGVVHIHSSQSQHCRPKPMAFLSQLHHFHSSALSRMEGRKEWAKCPQFARLKWKEYFCGDLGVRVKCDMYMICDMGMDVWLTRMMKRFIWGIGIRHSPTIVLQILQIKKG